MSLKLARSSSSGHSSSALANYLALARSERERASASEQNGLQVRGLRPSIQFRRTGKLGAAKNNDSDGCGGCGGVGGCGETAATATPPAPKVAPAATPMTPVFRFCQTLAELFLWPR